MKNFAIGTTLIILGAICVIFFAHLGLAKEWTLIPIVIIIIGGLFQLVAFLSAKCEMDDIDMKYKLTKIQFSVLNSVINKKIPEVKNEKCTEIIP